MVFSKRSEFLSFFWCRIEVFFAKGPEVEESHKVQSVRAVVEQTIRDLKCFKIMDGNKIKAVAEFEEVLDCVIALHNLRVLLKANKSFDLLPRRVAVPGDHVFKPKIQSGRKKAKKRHRNDVPKLNGAVLGGDPAVRYSAPPSWEGKVEQVKEMARRAAIKKRKLTEAVEKLVDEGGHHLVDAEGMAGLELRPVNDGMIDEVLEAGLVADVNIGEND
jgi:hypothetical protein